jgi:hypothetical protein
VAVKLTFQELWPAAAIGGALYFGRSLLDDGMTDEQRAARAQTNGGAPVDAPGQQLVGEADYIKVYKGQKVKAGQQFGIAVTGNNAHETTTAYPHTPRTFAVNEVVGYWQKEIGRLCGLANGIDFVGGATLPLDWASRAPRGELAKAFLLGTFGYRGIVNAESAVAILRGWDRVRPKLEAALTSGSFSGPTAGGELSVDGTVDFWESIRELAIIVDVDRAVPDELGIAWEALYEAAKEAPGLIGEYVAKVAAETGGALWRVLGQAAINLLLSPVGLAAIGVSAWLYRAELLGLVRRLH